MKHLHTIHKKVSALVSKIFKFKKYHFIKKLSTPFLKRHPVASFACVCLLLLTGTFFVTQGAHPHTSELAYTEYSQVSGHIGSVIPASCDSTTGYLGLHGDPDCPPAPVTCNYSGSDGWVNIGCPSGYSGQHVFADDHYSCSDGTAYVINSVEKQNTCTPPIPVPIDAVCGTIHYSCAAGRHTATGGVNQTEDASAWYWHCGGDNGGADATNCSEAKPIIINGSCGATTNSCSSGTLGANNPQPNNAYHWYCDGSGPGNISAFCWSQDGQCGPTTDTCRSGAVSVTGPTSWNCVGYNGGIPANCVAGSAVPPGTCANGATNYPTCNVFATICTVATDAYFGSLGCSGVCANSGTTINYPACPTVVSSVTSTGSLTSSALTCTVLTGASSCSVNLTWTTANPIGTSAITRNLPNPGSVVFSANSGGPSAVSVSPSYGAVTFYLYNNAILIAPPIAITASCASGGWDPVSSKCVDPQVVSAVVSGEFYPNPISNPAAITLTCSSASQYDVLNPLTSTSLIGGPKPYGGVVVYTPSIVAQANYILRCIQGSASDQVVRTYRPIPTPAVVRLNISPITIAKEEKVIISWDAQYPTNACTLTTKVICTNNVCSVGQNTFQSTLNTLFSTGQTDSNDPATSRLITTAVTTVAPGQINTTWRALGRKTTKFLYTTDITYDCTASGGGKETKRIQVTKIMEQ